MVNISLANEIVLWPHLRCDSFSFFNSSLLNYWKERCLLTPFLKVLSFPLMAVWFLSLPGKIKLSIQCREYINCNISWKHSWLCPLSSGATVSSFRLGYALAWLSAGPLRRDSLFCWLFFPPWSYAGGLDGKDSVCNARNLGLISGLGRSPGEGNGKPLQYSCLENSMDRGAWWVTWDPKEVDMTEWLTLSLSFSPL